MPVKAAKRAEGGGALCANDTHTASPALRQERSMRWLYRSGDRAFGVLNLKTADADEDYLVEQVAASVFRMMKLIPNAVLTYTVCIGQTVNCGCKGFESHGRCKHSDALLAKRQAGEV
jgi:hypothetical protein